MFLVSFIKNFANKLYLYNSPQVRFMIPTIASLKNVVRKKIKYNI